MYLLYFALWVVFNGRITLEICIFGIVIAGLVYAFSCKFMDHSWAKEKHMYRVSLKFLKYCGVLVLEIVKANFAVMHMILSEKEEAQPLLVDFDAEMDTPVGHALLANAITLTPGTITVMLEGDHYTVHCLDESYAQGIDDSIFVKELRSLER